MKECDGVCRGFVVRCPALPNHREWAHLPWGRVWAAYVQMQICPRACSHPTCILYTVSISNSSLLDYTCGYYSGPYRKYRNTPCTAHIECQGSKSEFIYARITTTQQITRRVAEDDALCEIDAQPSQTAFAQTNNWFAPSWRASWKPTAECLSGLIFTGLISRWNFLITSRFVSTLWRNRYNMCEESLLRESIAWYNYLVFSICYPNWVLQHNEVD